MKSFSAIVSILGSCQASCLKESRLVAGAKTENSKKFSNYDEINALDANNFNLHSFKTCNLPDGGDMIGT